jgi:hypothetical protein
VRPLRGSAFFLVGSVLFAVDSTFAEASALHGLDGVWPAASHDYPATDISHGLVIGGSAAFVPGRLFFVYGATSHVCDLLLRTPSARAVRAQISPSATTTDDPPVTVPGEREGDGDDPDIHLLRI